MHCDGSGPQTRCKVVSPPHSHPHANGLLLLDAGRTLMVNDVFNGSTTIYDVDPQSKMLTQRQKVVSSSSNSQPSSSLYHAKYSPIDPVSLTPVLLR